MDERSPLPRKLTRIVLVGFMGAGKSTVGPLLAERLGWRFVDADHHLERESGTTVAEIFRSQGEAGFRRLEAQTIAHLVEKREHVLALGGGALETTVTRSLLEEAEETAIVFLDAPVETLMERCERQPSANPAQALPVRPLFDELRANRTLLEQKLAARLPNYRIAHLTVATGELSAAEVAERVVSILGERVDGWAQSVPKEQAR